MGGLQLNHTRCNDSPAVRATALAASYSDGRCSECHDFYEQRWAGRGQGKGGELRVSARDHPGRPGTRFRKLVFEAARKSLLHMTIQESNPLVTHGDSSRQALRIVLPHRGLERRSCEGCSDLEGVAQRSRAEPLPPGHSDLPEVRTSSVGLTPAAHSGLPHLSLPSRGDLVNPLRAHPGCQHTAPAIAFLRMAGQLGEVTLDITERDARPVLVGVSEQVGGDQLGTLDHAHGVDRRRNLANRPRRFRRVADFIDDSGSAEKLRVYSPCAGRDSAALVIVLVIQRWQPSGCTHDVHHRLGVVGGQDVILRSLGVVRIHGLTITADTDEASGQG